MVLSTRLVELSRIVLDRPQDVEYMRNVRNKFLGENVYPVEHFIEANEHIEWFKSLKEERDFFFVIANPKTKERVGVVGCSQTKAKAGSTEIMIYIANDELIMAPFHAMSLLLKFVFEDLHLDRAYAVFFVENKRAIKFNSFFGFLETAREESKVVTELNRSEYLYKKHAFARFLY